MPHSPIGREELTQTIDRLIENLVNLRDETGEYVMIMPNGMAVDQISFDFWEWISGIGLYGMMQYYQITQKRPVLERIAAWFDSHLKEPAEKNVNTMVQMLTLAYLYEETGEKTYLPHLREWAEWLYRDLPRTEFGGFCHMTYGGSDMNRNQLWDDTLMMSVLTLTKIGLLLGEERYLQEARFQFLVHIQYLKEKRSGLWYHGWTFEGRHNFAGAFWGRGNSWITIVIPEYLALVNLPKQDAFRRFLLLTLQDQVQTLRQLQDESGMWHTLLDDPTSYLESSATAGIAYGLLKGIHDGCLGEEYRESALHALGAVVKNIDSTGALRQVSIGTGMGQDLDFYRTIRQAPVPFGQSMAILCLVEYLKELYQ